jgi:hypothetical protein
MPATITTGQKTFIKSLLEELDADLADFTGKELQALTFDEASGIIDELKAERMNRNYRK